MTKQEMSNRYYLHPNEHHSGAADFSFFENDIYCSYVMR